VLLRERDPTWRRPAQNSLFDLAFTIAPKRRIVFALEPGSEDQAIFVTFFAETVEGGVRTAAESSPAALPLPKPTPLAGRSVASSTVPTSTGSGSQPLNAPSSIASLSRCWLPEMRAGRPLGHLL
jgi:hypothetical protein